LLKSVGNTAGVFAAFDIFEQDHKFITPEAGQRINFSEGLLDAAGKGRKKAVADAMAETVIDEFEAVDIQIKHRKVIVITTFRPFDRHVQVLHKQGAIG
jgi:hypothetical protein